MEQRFRASIYVDVFIKGDKDLETARAEAQEQVEGIVKALSNSDEDSLIDLNYCNPYVGGVAHYNPRNLLKPLDREI